MQFPIERTRWDNLIKDNGDKLCDPPGSWGTAPCEICKKDVRKDFNRCKASSVTTYRCFVCDDMSSTMDIKKRLQVERVEHLSTSPGLTDDICKITGKAF